mmetsp:Transcript_10262/g.17202  ORF Transcript_10262/g.17202 Transcript_10262/m.17202 type:complete len:216 (-) Transcript_10262:483-1130(-)|eukprot:CAMPEP_0119300398 /NCGR_PEP_ID=MMETSP1333-20130426/2343_1 /TAXON_ID=418940 /ORGANISM="Scyphosphaera apsteinii, Strain RCC1455" /LENGTH=215 /DNA_ID=CAMNT_0007302155 /DNA_START=122 /DNA_END=769 /DNA_ORIENTATION=+
MIVSMQGSFAALPSVKVSVVKPNDHCQSRRADRGDTVRIIQNGYLASGPDGQIIRQIDSSCRNAPNDDDLDSPDLSQCDELEFVIGAGKILRGMERAVVGMCAGEVVEALIPPHLGYSDPKRDTHPPDREKPVPEDSWVVYRIQLLGVEPKARHSARRSIPTKISDTQSVVVTMLAFFDVPTLAVAMLGFALILYMCRSSPGPGPSAKKKKKKKG